MAKKRTDKPRKPEEVHQVIVRMPHRTWERLEKAAQAHFRTINMHILWLVEEHLKQQAELPDESA